MPPHNVIWYATIPLDPPVQSEYNGDMDERDRCYFFGVMDKSYGHHPHYGRRILHRPPERFPVPIRTLDGGLLPPRLPPEEGRAELHHIGSWTFLCFWDRSVDKRLGSNCVFVFDRILFFDDAVEKAESDYPDIWARFPFDVRLRE